MGIDVERALRRAKSRAAKGNLDEAADLYRGILARYPQNRRAQAALSDLGRGADVVPPASAGMPDLTGLHDLIGQDRHSEAAELAAGLAQVYPSHPEVYELQANALAQLGDYEAALAATKRLLDLAPNRARAWCSLGKLLSILGETEMARLVIGRAIGIDPDLAEAHVSLGLVLLDGGDEGGALQCVGKAVDLLASNAAGLLRIGHMLRFRGASDMAALAAHKATQADPASAEAFELLGDLRAARRNWPGTVQALAEAARLAPANARLWAKLGAARCCHGDLRAGLADLLHALDLDPGDAVIRVELGGALLSLGRTREAIVELRRVLADDPAHAPAHRALGNALVAVGEPGDAICHFRRAVACDPDDGASLFNLAGLVPKAELGPLAGVLDAAEARGGSDAFQTQIAFAQAQLALRLDRPEPAMSALARGGRLRKAALGYDHSEAAEQFRQIRASIPETFAVDHAPLDGPVPIFVIGMPRSGTSLCEQILASHSAVHGAGELEELRVAILRHARVGEALTARAARGIRTDYMQALRDLAPAGAAYVVDKMPLNFRWVGHIRAALPEARILHVRRDARAVCWSNYRQYFTSEGMAWTFDQQDVAAYWKLYAGLMAHWQSLFPGRIDEMVYEDLTMDQEGQSRRLLGALGLPWEDAVLAFHENTRAVRTASRMQVRRKMYQGSSDAWRRYEPWLGPMLAELARA